ncbi:response regulator [uncultured Methanospirillum sp.]|uniref:ATP-binding response regulator n=1 Tax=uncultured Methanospirillum sp. TaxID=262503 RepID=UPI0029C7B508|nr:response regulator [uncultured Methanospirillum sp.]
MVRARLSVLVVDDEFSLRFISKRYLEEAGPFLVRAVDSGDSALELLESQDNVFDAIVSDYYMPDMNGMDLLRQVRSRHGNIPFILFTGRDEEQVIRDAKTAGADHVIVKNHDLKSQWIEIAHLLEKAARERTMGRILPQVLIPHIQPENSDESKSIQNSRWMTAIGEFSVRLAEIPTEYEFYADLSDLFRQVGAAGDIFFRYRPDNQSLCAASLSFRHGVRDQIAQILGKDPEDLNIPISVERYQKLIGSAIERDEDLTTISEGEISRFASSAIRKAGGFDHYLTVAYAAGEELYGASLLAINSTDPPEPLFMTVASLVALYMRGEQQRTDTGLDSSNHRTSGEIPDSHYPDDGDGRPECEYQSDSGLFMQIVSNMADMAAICDLENRYRYVTRSYERNLGYASEELVGRYMYEFVRPENLEQIMTTVSLMLKGEIPYARYQRLHKNGQYRWIESTGRLLYEKDGSCSGYIINTRDITDRVTIEEALHKSKEKLNILSSITRHDIQNQLQALEAFCDLIELRVNNDKPAAEYLAYMRQCCEMIHQQIAFARDYQELGDSHPVWQNIETIARVAASNTLPETVNLEIETGNAEFFADPMFMHVFYNLFDNVKRHGGQVTRVSISFSEKGGSGVITISDDGPGIADDQKERIFEKGVGENTGLGLFLVREILAITGISISETGVFRKGSSFFITAPPHVWRRKRGSDK